MQADKPEGNSEERTTVARVSRGRVVRLMRNRRRYSAELVGI